METGIVAKKELSLAEIRTQHEALFNSFFDGVIQQVQLDGDAGTEIARSLTGAIEKRDEIVDILFSVEAESERLMQMEAAITARRRQYEAFSNSLRDVIRFQMDNLGVKRVDGLIHRLLLREGKDHVVIDDESALPADVLNWKPLPDRDAISKKLHAGEHVPGAHLEPAKKSLVVT